MLETLLFEELQNKKYAMIFVVSLVITALAIFVTHQFLPFNRGMEVVFVVSLGLAYPLLRYLINVDVEEEQLAEKYDRPKFHQRHIEEVMVYMSMFLGVFLAIVASSVMLDNTFYQSQSEKICEIRQDCEITGNSASFGNFVGIVTNNFSVFVVTFLMSFILAAGMIFILVWNASVFGVFIGNMLSQSLLVSLSYLPHGLLEITSYVVAGIAGTILSFSVIHRVRGKIDDHTLKQIITDIYFLVLSGIILLLIAGVIEVL